MVQCKNHIRLRKFPSLTYRVFRYRVASIVGADQVGVARSADLVAVKVRTFPNDDVSLSLLKAAFQELLDQDYMDTAQLSVWKYRGSVWVM